MKLAFCLYRYFPFGGLQRDFLRIAKACLKRGHTVQVYTGEWEGDLEEGLAVEILPVRGLQNHSRCASFAELLKARLKDQAYDLVLGFNKMPGLDIYYAADVCTKDRFKKQKSFWARCLPRNRAYLRQEKAVFSPASLTNILVLAEKQGEIYRNCYQLPLNRFHLLPPGIAKDRKAPPQSNRIREAFRKTQQLTDEQSVLLMVGSGFKTKGLDRALEALASLPPELKCKTQLWVVGQDNPTPFIKQAKKLGLNLQLRFFGGQHEIMPFFLAADFLLHPAYHENTGTVLLEALASGLPVLTLDICGYAPYITEAQAGLVLPSPYEQTHFNFALEALLKSPLRQLWKTNALAFAESADIYSLPERAVDFIETCPSKHSPKQFEHFMQLEGECFREQKNRRTQRIFINNQSYFIKQHFGVGWKEIFKNLLQFKLPIISSKNEVKALQRLEHLSILAPRVHAYGYRGFNPANRRSFVLMEELKNLVSLEDFCRHWKKQAPAFSTKKALIAEVATTAQRLHQNGINHRDFYLCHFLLDPGSLPNKKTEKNETALKIHLIDLHRAGLHKTLPQRWLLKDLAGLYFSSKDCGLSSRDYWRFIKIYRDKPLRTIIKTEAEFWQKVIHAGEKLYHAHCFIAP